MEKKIEFKILDSTWSLSLVNPYHSSLNESGGTILNGKCNFACQEIHISNNLIKEKLEKIIIHELTHAVILQFMANKDEFTHEEVAIFNENYLQYIYNLFLEIKSKIE